jgi:hypothetical protein
VTCVRLHRLFYGVIVVAGITLALGFVGCSGSSNWPEVAPVQGRVTYQGQPVVGAVVTFICQGAPRFASGKTDAEGSYTLTTFEPDDGAVVGHNTVAVTMPIATPGESAPDSPLSGEYFDLLESSRKAEAAGSKLPKRYANAETSGLTADVAQGTNRHDFKLED